MFLKRPVLTSSYMLIPVSYMSFIWRWSQGLKLAPALCLGCVCLYWPPGRRIWKPDPPATCAPSCGENWQLTPAADFKTRSFGQRKEDGAWVAMAALGDKPARHANDFSQVHDLSHWITVLHYFFEDTGLELGDKIMKLCCFHEDSYKKVLVLKRTVGT